MKRFKTPNSRHRPNSTSYFFLSPNANKKKEKTTFQHSIEQISPPNIFMQENELIQLFNQIILLRKSWLIKELETKQNKLLDRLGELCTNLKYVRLASALVDFLPGNNKFTGHELTSFYKLLQEDPHSDDEQFINSNNTLQLLKEIHLIKKDLEEISLYELKGLKLEDILKHLNFISFNNFLNAIKKSYVPYLSEQDLAGHLFKHDISFKEKIKGDYTLLKNFFVPNSLLTFLLPSNIGPERQGFFYMPLRIEKWFTEAKQKPLLPLLNAPLLSLPPFSILNTSIASIPHNRMY